MRQRGWRRRCLNYGGSFHALRPELMPVKSRAPLDGGDTSFTVLFMHINQLRDEAGKHLSRVIARLANDRRMLDRSQQAIAESREMLARTIAN